MAEATLRINDSASVAIARLRELTTTYPDYWFGWLVYADYMTHFGSAVGIPRRDALAAFQRTVTLNPNLLPAWEHYAWLALLERDTTAASRALAGLSRFGDEIAETVGWDEYTSLALADRLIRRDSAGAVPLMERHVADLADRPDPVFAATALVRHALPNAQMQATRRILAASPPAASLQFHQDALLRAYAQRGAWDSVLMTLDQAHQPSALGSAAGAYRLATLAALIGAIGPASAAERRPAAARAAEHDPVAHAELVWLDGVLALVRNDTSGLAERRAELARHSGAAEPLRRSLAGLERGLLGERDEAARDLAALAWGRAETSFPNAAAYPALLPVTRLIAARWLAAAGDYTEAARLLEWIDGAYTTHAGGELDTAVLPMVIYERGRIAEADGRARAAAGYYREFLRMYDLAPDSHNPQIRHAAEFIREGPAT